MTHTTKYYLFQQSNDSLNLGHLLFHYIHRVREKNCIIIFTKAENSQFILEEPVAGLEENFINLIKSSN